MTYTLGRRLLGGEIVTALIVTLGLFAGLMVIAMAPGVLWGEVPDRRGEAPSRRTDSTTHHER